MVNKHSKLMGLLLIVLVASALISLGIGRYALSLEQILQILTAKLTALLWGSDNICIKEKKKFGGKNLA